MLVSETCLRHVGTAAGSRPSPTASGAHYHNVGVRPTYSPPQHFQTSESTSSSPQTWWNSAAWSSFSSTTPRPPTPSPHLYGKALTGLLTWKGQQWAVLQKVPWIIGDQSQQISAVITLSTGYHIQFRCRPPVYTGVRHTIIHNPHQSEALAHKVQMLLRKGAIELVDPQVISGDFFPFIFWSQRKTADFD